MWQLEAGGGFTEEWHGAWRYGIVAHPVAHSLSPAMQQAAFDNQCLAAHFERFDITPEKLPYFIQQVRDEPISGLAVSLPHKEAIIPLLDGITPTAERIGAVNTVYWRDEKLIGDNTDAIGFWQSLVNDSRFTLPDNALVIGAGGVARAIVFILREQGINVTITNRTIEKAERLATEFGAKASFLSEVNASDYGLVVNSTSVGLKSDESTVSAAFWHGFSGIAFDAVFDPLVSTFLSDAQSAGAHIITGETMLFYQGVKQFEIWTEHSAPLDVMRNALKTALAKKT